MLACFCSPNCLNQVAAACAGATGGCPPWAGAAIQLPGIACPGAELRSNGTVVPARPARAGKAIMYLQEDLKALAAGGQARHTTMEPDALEDMARVVNSTVAQWRADAAELQDALPGVCVDVPEFEHDGNAEWDSGMEG